MNENWKFSDIPYHRPDVEALQARYDALTRRAREAACPEDLLDVVRQRDALQQEVALCQAVAFIRAFHDVTDEFYQTELQDTLPRLEGSLDSQSLAAAIAKSPYAPALDRAFGPQLRRLLTLDHRIHAGGQGPAGPHLPADGPVSAADGLRQVPGPWGAAQRRTAAGRSGQPGPGAPQGRL